MQEKIRLQIYRHFVQTGKAPSVHELSRSMDLAEAEVRGGLHSLAGQRMLLLQGDGEVLMAPPYSAVPTLFVVENETGSWWANCIWDALGIPAAMGRDADVVTSCGCCGDALRLQVRDGSLREPQGVVHFTVPALRWWENLVFA